MTRIARIVVAMLAVLWLGILPGRAQGDAQPMPQAAGTWRIEAEAESSQDNVSLATSAAGNKDGTFALWCRQEPAEHYLFVIRDPRLAKFSRGDDVAVGLRVPNQELVRLQAGAPGDGSVIVQERVHQTAFSLILAMLAPDAARVEVSVDEHQWTFPLDGFATLMPSLIKRCGFAPDPERARQKGR